MNPMGNKVFKKTVAAAAALVTLAAGALTPVAEANIWQERREALSRGSSSSGVRSAQSFAALPVSSPSLETVIHGLPAASSAAQDPSLPPARFAAQLDRLPSALSSLPASAAEVRAVNLSPKAGAPLVVLVQDVHAVTEAQENIGRILEHLSPRAGGAGLLVGMEGAAGSFDIDVFRPRDHQEIRRDVNTMLLRRHILTGAEHFALNTDGAPPTLWGVEDEALYKANVAAYRESRTVMERSQAALRALSAAAAAKRDLLFSPELKALDGVLDAYQRGEAGLAQLAALLPSEGCQNLRRFKEAIALETSIDFKAVEAERSRLIREAADKLPKSDLQTLVDMSLSYRAGHMSHGAYHAGLKSLLSGRGISLAGYPAFETYIRYVLAADRIDPSALFAELQQAEASAGAALAATAEARDLFAARGDLRLLGRLLRHELTTEDWARYGSRRAEIIRLAERLGVKGLALDFLPVFEAFYSSAVERNDALARNVLGKAGASASASAPSITVLIAGGFHTPGLAAALKRLGASTVTLMPKLDKIEGSASDYLQVFSGRRTPLEKMLLGEKLMLSATPSSASNSLDGNTAAQAIFKTLERVLPQAAIDAEASGQAQHTSVIRGDETVEAVVTSLEGENIAAARESHGAAAAALHDAQLFEGDRRLVSIATYRAPLIERSAELGGQTSLSIAKGTADPAGLAEILAEAGAPENDNDPAASNRSDRILVLAALTGTLLALTLLPGCGDVYNTYNNTYVNGGAAGQQNPGRTGSAGTTTTGPETGGRQGFGVGGTSATGGAGKAGSEAAAGTASTEGGQASEGGAAAMAGTAGMGTAGTAGSEAQTGGTAGTDGGAGSAGTAGIAGTAGTDGNAGTAGMAGSVGTAGTAATEGGAPSTNGGAPSTEGGAPAQADPATVEIAPAQAGDRTSFELGQMVSQAAVPALNLDNDFEVIWTLTGMVGESKFTQRTAQPVTGPGTVVVDLKGLVADPQAPLQVTLEYMDGGVETLALTGANSLGNGITTLRLDPHNNRPWIGVGMNPTFDDDPADNDPVDNTPETDDHVIVRQANGKKALVPDMLPSSKGRPSLGAWILLVPVMALGALVLAPVARLVSARKSKVWGLVLAPFLFLQACWGTRPEPGVMEMTDAGAAGEMAGVAGSAGAGRAGNSGAAGVSQGGTAGSSEGGKAGSSEGGKAGDTAQGGTDAGGTDMGGTDAGSAGSAGVGGMGGEAGSMAGAGGHAGSAGMGGTAGSAGTAGMGGMGGAAGMGGSAGSAGMAGTGGSSGMSQGTVEGVLAVPADVTSGPLGGFQSTSGTYMIDLDNDGEVLYRATGMVGVTEFTQSFTSPFEGVFDVLVKAKGVVAAGQPAASTLTVSVLTTDNQVLSPQGQVVVVDGIMRIRITLPAGKKGTSVTFKAAFNGNPTDTDEFDVYQDNGKPPAAAPPAQGVQTMGMLSPFGWGVSLAFALWAAVWRFARRALARIAARLEARGHGLTARVVEALDGMYLSIQPGAAATAAGLTSGSGPVFMAATPASSPVNEAPSASSNRDSGEDLRTPLMKDLSINPWMRSDAETLAANLRVIRNFKLSGQSVAPAAMSDADLKEGLSRSLANESPEVVAAMAAYTGTQVREVLTEIAARLSYVRQDKRLTATLEAAVLDVVPAAAGNPARLEQLKRFMAFEEKRARLAQARELPAVSQSVMALHVNAGGKAAPVSAKDFSPSVLLSLANVAVNSSLKDLIVLAPGARAGLEAALRRQDSLDTPVIRQLKEEIEKGRVIVLEAQELDRMEADAGRELLAKGDVVEASAVLETQVRQGGATLQTRILALNRASVNTKGLTLRDIIEMSLLDLPLIVLDDKEMRALQEMWQKIAQYA